jgi:predicted transcriptional regulator
MSKLTVQMSDEMNDVLGELADSRGLAKTQVLRRAVALMKYLDDASNDGRELLLRNPETGEEQQLVLESKMR